uniref:Uncharacterized protein n=1 Tax=Glossina palpalis gambiensis TaxID=67801 RepID=A0A1B0BD22_9MUSC
MEQQNKIFRSDSSRSGFLPIVGIPIDRLRLVMRLIASDISQFFAFEILLVLRQMPDLFAVAFTLSLRITESPLIKLCFTNDNGFNSLTISSAPSPTEGLLSSMLDTFVISISTESLSLSLSLLSKDPVIELRSVINLLDNSDWDIRNSKN